MQLTSTPKWASAKAMVILIALAFAGGYADAATYVLAGSFTGHLTGNTVLAALSLAHGQYSSLGRHLLAVVFFAIATYIGLLLASTDFAHSRALSFAVSAEALLVAVAPLGTYLHSSHAGLIIIICLCLALGLQNGAFHKIADVSVHATYVTGDITTLLTSLVPQKSGASPANAVPRRPTMRILILTWCTFTVGAVVAGFMASRYGAYALWLLELPFLSAALASTYAETDSRKAESEPPVLSNTTKRGEGR